MTGQPVSLRVMISRIDRFAFQKVPDYVKDEMRDIGKEVRNEAKKNVSRAPPNHPQIRTGRLKKSLRYRSWRSKWRFTVRVYVDKTAPYGSYLERGFLHVSGRRVGPYPFLNPAFRTILKKHRW